jgi:hypothetical protein
MKMRAYFPILVGLMLVATWMSYDIASTVPFDRAGAIPSPDPHPALDDNGRSPCFEKRYSPDVRDCGGLLKYSMRSDLWKSDKGHNERPIANKSASERTAWQDRRARRARHDNAAALGGW